MLFTEAALDTIRTDLQRLGLHDCPVCKGSALHTDRRPVWMYVGGTADTRDATTNMVFLLRVFCDVCGHVLLFDVERFVKGDERIWETS